MPLRTADWHHLLDQTASGLDRNFNFGPLRCPIWRHPNFDDNDPEQPIIGCSMLRTAGGDCLGKQIYRFTMLKTISPLPGFSNEESWNLLKTSDRQVSLFT